MRLRALALFAAAFLAAAPVFSAWQKEKDGVLVRVGGTTVRLRVLSDAAVRVVAWPEKSPEPDRPSLAVVADAGDRAVRCAGGRGPGACVKTKRLTVRVDTGTGRVTFDDEAGRVLLREAEGGGRTFTPVTTYGVATMAVRQEFEPAEGESLYGLGQHQDRLLDIAGRDLDLWQHNREVVIPFLVSTRGWGLLWDNPAQTRFGHPEAIVPVPASAVADDAGRARRADRRVTSPTPRSRSRMAVVPAAAPGLQRGRRRVGGGPNGAGGRPPRRDRREVPVGAVDGLARRAARRRVRALHRACARLGEALGRRPTARRLLEPVPPRDRRRACAARGRAKRTRSSSSGSGRTRRARSS